MKVSKVFVLVLLLSACRGHHAAGPQPHSASPESITVIGALDGTLSYEQLEEGRQQMGALIAKVPPGSDFSARWVTSDSYSASCAIASASLPDVSSRTTNPFDQRGKAREAEQRRALECAREALLQKIATAPSPNARRTDIHGFFVHVAERRRTARSKRFVVAIASDLDANVFTYRGHLGAGDLDGCDVVVLACAAPNPGLRAAWDHELRSWGVASVRFVAVGEPLSADILGGTR